MKLYIKNVEGLVLPSQGHPGEDAGYDIVAASDPQIKGDESSIKGMYRSIDYIEYKTNLFWAPNTDTEWNGVMGPGSHINEIDWHIELFPRSSLSNYRLSLANHVGTIDKGYRNEILVRFKYLWQPEDLEIYNYLIYGSVRLDKIYKKGDKIIQMKPRPNTQIQIEMVNELPDSQRKLGSFGSTGA